MLGTQRDGLDQAVRGRVVRPEDPGYDDARSVYNAMIDKRPRAVVRCADTADVVAALGWARAAGVEVAVRGGGHSGPGYGSVDGGLVVDLGDLRAVDVDAGRRTVRVGGGCTSADVDAATYPHGLAVPLGLVSTTGVGGLTLGGGSGHLTREHGLTIDNLLEAEVVLADGRVVTASPSVHPDLFWGLRGGGGNLGVVVRLTFRAHPVRDVFAGPLFWDLADARDVLAAYRDFLPGADERLGLFAGLKTVPPVDPFPREHQGRRAAALVACFDGDAHEGAAVMAPLLDVLPPPLFDWRSTMPYPSAQTMFDALMPPGLQWYWRGGFVRELTDDAIEAHLEQARTLEPGARSVMHLYPIDGAVHRVPSDATAWATRDARWSMVIAGIDDDPARAGEITRWAKDYWDAVHPYSDDGGYVNFMMGDEHRLRATYGGNYARLAAVKAAYDPTNVFHVNANVPPAPGPTGA